MKAVLDGLLDRFGPEFHTSEITVAEAEQNLPVVMEKIRREVGTRESQVKGERTRNTCKCVPYDHTSWYLRLCTALGIP